MAELIKDMKLKSGKIIKAGTICKVEPKGDIYAVITAFDVGGKNLKIGILSIKLGKYFDDFINVDEKEIEAACQDEVVPSLRGFDVEPDGHDEEGWPSILLAAGII